MSDLKFAFGDPMTCTGCMICANVCSMFYFKVLSPTRSRVRVMRFEDGLDFPLFCRNCEDAPCKDACPENAIARTSKGIVIVSNAKCTGCGACVKVCPYDAISINPDSNKAIKCIACGECVKRCPVSAIWITTENDLKEKDRDNRIALLYDKHKKELYSKGEFL
jgi:carbon-monoxide dehydrogenase iron sulfur subunit